MDPNVTLEQLRAALEARAQVPEPIDPMDAWTDYDERRADLAEDVCELAGALVGWLDRGGFLPAAWQACVAPPPAIINDPEANPAARHRAWIASQAAELDDLDPRPEVSWTRPLYLACVHGHGGQGSQSYRVMCRLRRRMERHGMTRPEWESDLSGREFDLYGRALAVITDAS